MLVSIDDGDLQAAADKEILIDDAGVGAELAVLLTLRLRHLKPVVRCLEGDIELKRIVLLAATAAGPGVFHATAPVCEKSTVFAGKCEPRRLPDVQINSIYQKYCQALLLKIFIFRFSERRDCLGGSRGRQRGVRAIATNVGCGERWTYRRSKASGADTDGEIVWS
jgi:hypothetical protein